MVPLPTPYGWHEVLVVMKPEDGTEMSLVPLLVPLGHESSRVRFTLPDHGRYLSGDPAIALGAISLSNALYNLYQSLVEDSRAQQEASTHNVNV